MSLHPVHQRSAFGQIGSAGHSSGEYHDVLLADIVQGIFLQSRLGVDTYTLCTCHGVGAADGYDVELDAASYEDVGGGHGLGNLEAFGQEDKCTWLSVHDVYF